MKEEIVDIVDEHDNVIGCMPRSQAYAENRLSSLRAAWLLVKNQKNQFWIPRRHASKKLLPSYLDGSAVGHVSSGESYEQAMIRETQEELQFDISSMPYTLLGAITPVDSAVCFMQVFELEVSNDFVIDYNHNDFSEAAWLSAEEIITKAHEGEKIKDTLLIIMAKFYGVSRNLFETLS